jgi:hypothetical protein
MNWIKITLGLALIGLMCACSRKKFDTTLLSKNRNRIEHSDFVKYYDNGAGFFYLLTFYKTIEKNPGEDFTFEGVSTYKGSQESDGNIEGDSTKIQYLALYFFADGGVVYHTKYTIAPDEKYVPLDLTSFKDLYEKDKITKRQDKIEFMRYQPIMQGYQSKKIYAQQLAKPGIKDEGKSSKDSMYAVRNRQLFNQAILENRDSTETRRAAQGTPRVQAAQPAGESLVKLYLERGGKKSPIYLLGKHQPERRDQKEAILIEQIFYLQEVQSAGGRYIPALLSEVFDLGTVTETDKPFKSLFWFRLEKKQDYMGNQPNKKR